MNCSLRVAILLLNISSLAFVADTHAYGPQNLAEARSPLFDAKVLCTNNCADHEEGYRWAEDRGIDDPDDCTGKTAFFIEGCESYVAEQQSESSDQADEQ